VVATCVFFPIFILEYLSEFRTDILQQIFCNKHILHMYSGHFSGQTGPPAVDNPLGGTCHPAIVPDSLAGPDPAHGERGGDTPNARGLFPTGPGRTARGWGPLPWHRGRLPGGRTWGHPGARPPPRCRFR
jgi:hypothetical protein